MRDVIIFGVAMLIGMLLASAALSKELYTTGGSYALPGYYQEQVVIRPLTAPPITRQVYVPVVQHHCYDRAVTEEIPCKEPTHVKERPTSGK